MEIIPGRGWDNIHLGDTADQVRQALAENGIGHSEEHDPFCWELDDPSCTLQFSAGELPRLVQIVFNTELALYQRQPLVGLPFAEALLALGIRSFDDTLWSAVDLDCEYSHGVPLPNSQRPTSCDAKTLVDGGTLWIKSMGIGLCTNLGAVSDLAMRQPADVPTVGCGPATEATIMAATNVVRPVPAAIAKGASSPGSASPLTKIPFSFRMILAVLALVFVALPIYLVIRDVQAWQKSIPVVGIVVESKPPGPFPDEVVVEYPLPDDSKHRVTIPTTYTTAREVGNEVDLLYRPDDPTRALTRIQIRDEGFTFSPYWLFGSVLAGTFCLVGAFPNHVRLNRGRKSSST